jgi:uncharacterized protein (TIGR02266 family)
MPPGDNEGSSRRIADRAGVVLQLQYRNAGHLLVSYCTNLSRGGLFVPSHEPLAPGSRITVSLRVPGQDNPATLAAEVRWVREFDAAEGPAGMGLAFDDVDDVLGARIDGIVSDFEPMRIALLGDRPRAIASLGAKVRSLVSCETTHHSVDPDTAPTLAHVDLVIVDVDSAPESSLRLLARLAEFVPPPPRLALCDPKSGTVWTRALGLARVVKTPIDSDELRTSVLETLTQVELSTELGD